MDPTGTGVENLVLNNVFLQDNFSSYQQCMVSYLYPAQSGMVMVNGANTAGSSCIANSNMHAKLIVNGVAGNADINGGQFKTPTDGHGFTASNGTVTETELRSIGAGMSPSIVPHATLPVPAVTTWTGNSGCTATSGALSPDGTTDAVTLTATGGGSYIAPYGYTDYVTHVAVGDVVLWGGWVRDSAGYNPGNGGPGYSIGLGGGGSGFMYDQGALASTGSFEFPMVGDWWHPIAGMTTITAADGNWHGINMQIGCDSHGVSYYNTWMIYVKASEGIPVSELRRWRQQLLHGYVPPNMPAGVLVTGLPLANITATQSANGADILSGSRATDTTPSGNFINFKSAAGASLFKVDVAGTITTPITGSTQCLHVNSSGVVSGSGADCAGGGSVTSVALTTPAWLTVGNSPITSSGTLAVTATSGQTANQFLATPNAAAGAVGLRAIVAADVPNLAESQVTSLTTDLAAKAPLASPTFSGNVTVTGGGGATGTISTNGSNRVDIGTGGGDASGDVFVSRVIAGSGGLQILGNGTQLTLNGSPLVASSKFGVGTGSSTPALQFQVVGADGFPAASGTTQTGNTRMNNGNVVLDFGTVAAGPAAWLQATNATDLSNKYFIALNPNGGNVSINKTTNAYTLDVGGTLGATSATFTGTVDASGAAHTLPSVKGTIAGKPSTCTVGEEYFATDATAGQNKYYCTATNTWTQQSGGGSQPTSIAATYTGSIPASQIFALVPMSIAMTVPSGCTNSQGVLGTADSTGFTISLQKNGTQFGTMSFAASATTATFTCSSSTAFAVGDVFKMVGPSSAPATGATFGGSIYATR